MEMKILDYTLIPMGMMVMVVYHLWLLRRIVRRPSSTIVGLNVINRRLWVQAMMEDVSKNGVLAVQTLRNNIMASTLLASTAIMLTSLIAVLMTSGSGQRSGWYVLGDKSDLAFSIKFFSILVCFLVAFLFNVQSIRYYSHASVLINVPSKHIISSPMSLSSKPNIGHDLDYVASTVNRGSYFWSLGLRAFYFSFPLFLWIFGPIPMFCSSCVLVFLLYFLDVAFEFKAVGVTDAEEMERLEEAHQSV
ncbi:PREDICTED: uncharacterized protein LOC104798992 [Tarenaya hassleriana]|uniref:uncharacterized protein LOC104798992 n=1 Tax=Tarenaya hassleriana TaxID=28532 RepID=UPI00053C84F9|nr:PREDICTED: uncharacterized protein LOC104798992 [Tarenaya hassleriana]